MECLAAVNTPLLGSYSVSPIGIETTRRFTDFSHFVTSMTAPVASDWSIRRVGFAPTGKRRLSTAHRQSRCGRIEQPLFSSFPVGLDGGVLRR
jgi:hypothetical protein